MSKIIRIAGTNKVDDYYIKTSSIKFASGSNSTESAFAHALYRAKKQNKPIRCHQLAAGKSWSITEATEKLPKVGTFYDVYKDSTIWN